MNFGNKNNSTKVSESVFTEINGSYKNCRGEGPDSYKFRIFYEKGIDLSKFTIKNGVLCNENFESADDYIERLKNEGFEFKSIADQKLDKESLNKLKKETKLMVKKGYIKGKSKVFKKTIIGILSFVASLGAYYGINKGSAMTIKHDEHDVIQNTDYEPYTNIPKGYYNEHPLKICISDRFSTFSQFMMRKGLEYLDENAYGAKFDIVVDDVRTTDAPVKVMHATKDFGCYYGEIIDALGWTWNEFKESDFISGDIVIKENAFHPYTIANTIVHEACHMIFRLRHSSNPDSIMCRAPSNIFLSKQDIENINTTLPPDRAPNEAISVYTEKDATVSYVDYFKKLSKQNHKEQKQVSNCDEDLVV